MRRERRVLESLAGEMGVCESCESRGWGGVAPRGITVRVCVLFHEKGYNFKWGEGIWCIGKREEINLFSRGEDRRSGRDGKTIQGHFDLELPKISQGELEKVRG